MSGAWGGRGFLYTRRNGWFSAPTCVPRTCLELSWPRSLRGSRVSLLMRCRENNSDACASEQPAVCAGQGHTRHQGQVQRRLSRRTAGPAGSQRPAPGRRPGGHSSICVAADSPTGSGDSHSSLRPSHLLTTFTTATLRPLTPTPAPQHEAPSAAVTITHKRFSGHVPCEIASSMLETVMCRQVALYLILMPTP